VKVNDGDDDLRLIWPSILCYATMMHMMVTCYFASDY